MGGGFAFLSHPSVRIYILLPYAGLNGFFYSEKFFRTVLELGTYIADEID